MKNLIRCPRCHRPVAKKRGDGLEFLQHHDGETHRSMMITSGKSILICNPHGLVYKSLKKSDSGKGKDTVNIKKY